MVPLLLLPFCTLAAVPDLPTPTDRPQRMPLVPLSTQESAHRDSLTRYGVGLLRQRNELPVDALTEFEAAARQAPDAPEPLRPLVNLYAELGREPAAIRTARRILELDPKDAATGHRLGQLLYESKKYAEAVSALQQAAASPRIQKQYAIRFGLLRDLARAAEAAADWANATQALDAGLALAASHRAGLLKSGEFESAQDLERQLAQIQEAQGRAHTARREFAEAVEAYVAAAKRYADPQRAHDPDAADRLADHLSRVLAARGEPAAAADALARYLELGPLSPEPYQRYADLLRQAGRSGQVLPALSALSQRHPTIEAIQWVRIAEDAVRSPVAADHAFRAVARSTQNPAAFPVIVRYYRQSNRPRELLELADELFRAIHATNARDTQDHKKPPRPEDVVRVRALTAAMKQEPGLSRQLLQAMESPPRRTTPFTTDTWELVGWLARRDGQTILAERAFREATSSGTNQEAAAQLLELLAKQRKWTAIRSECARLITLHRGNRPLVYEIYLARALAELGHADEALRTVSELSVRAEGVVWKRLQRVRILNILGRHTEAVSECQAILKDHPSPADAASIRYQLADSYGYLKQYLKAEAELRIVLDHDPDDMMALNNLGYNLADQNRKLGEAESRIRRAIELDRDERLRLGNAEPQSGIYLDSLGWVLFRREKFEEAYTILEQATRLPDSGMDAVVWDHLGDTAFRLGKKQRAQEAWSKAESLYTNTRLGQEGGRLEELRRKLKLVE